MAQVKIPSDFTLQVTLLTDIIAKNNDPDSVSPLTDWLVENKIDLAADQQAAAKAVEQENNRAEQEIGSAANFTLRDSKFTPVFAFIRQAAQVLKKFYKQNPSTLLDWGIPIVAAGRIKWPSSFIDLNSIAAAFFTKLSGFPAGKSPLEVYMKLNNIDAATLSKDNADALKNNSAAVAAAKAAEAATEMRNLLWKDPLQHIHSIADYLKSLSPNNPRSLGDWGFVVDEGKEKSKLRKSKFKIGETKTLTGMAIGSILTNTGLGNLIVYKGKGTAGTSSTLKPGDKMGLVAGYSIITVVNPSTLQTAALIIENNK